MSNNNTPSASPGRPFAVFDIDGTLIRWQLYHALADALVRQGAIGVRDFEPARIARMNWKRRSNQDSYNEYEHTLVGVFDKALVGLPEHVFAAAAQTVFSEHKDQVYVYTRDLIASLKDQNYLLFAISGSPAIIVNLLATYYGFDDYAATTYPVQSGYYTGEKVKSIGKKAELLQALIAKHSTTVQNSLAIGDSEGDIAMLEMVQKPIAFNPTKKLFETAQAKDWTVVIERKNVVYNLAKVGPDYRATVA